MTEPDALAPKPTDFADGYWVCACVKRKKGVMTHIKGNHPRVKVCRRCGVTKAQSEEVSRGVK